MKRETLYDDGISLWPKVINIKDGKFIPETKGFYSQSLISSWEKVESLAEGDDWKELSVWIIYKLLHKISLNKFTLNEYEVSLSEVNKLEFYQLLEEELKGDGYSEMLSQFGRG